MKYYKGENIFIAYNEDTDEVTELEEFGQGNGEGEIEVIERDVSENFSKAGKKLKKNKVEIKLHGINTFKKKQDSIKITGKTTAIMNNKKTGDKPWTKKHAECLGCGKTENRHQGQGYCSKCYQRKDKIIETTEGPQERYKYECLDCGTEFDSTESDINKVYCPNNTNHQLTQKV